ncbi:hypothetical protein ATANTOWER_012390 [Ataeniobius toweri]|uniref:Ig-like domain-containing protein n=1 Tax=Ataeniobius toweri TaxID=208326 RepID=A0ABU7BSW7_9TELE|nr:hypothetical protein [Ataeniobius toweri]
MILFWVTLLLLHQGSDTLVPVTTVQLGETATLTCLLPDEKRSSSVLHWYKQSAGNTLKLIVNLLENVKPTYESELLASRLDATYKEKISNLTIWKTTQGDEGMYHCALIDWNKNSWQATYLLLKGNTERTSTYNVAQWPTVSEPAHPGDLVTLQCLVLSDSDEKTCSGDPSVFWFRERSAKSHAGIIYTGGNKNDGCEKTSDTQNRCIFNFSTTLSSSDAGIYYCVVAACGEILFGNGTKLGVKGSSLWSQDAGKVILLLGAVLAISLAVIAVLMGSIKKNSCVHCKAGIELQNHISGQKTQHRTKGGWIYSTAIFTTIDSDWAGLKKEAERKRIYAAAKAFGLN